MNAQRIRTPRDASVSLQKNVTLKGGHLLSTFNKPESSPSGTGSPPAETKQRREREPSIDAEPLSTEDEPSDDDELRRPIAPEGPTLEEKLAANANSSPASGPSGYGSGKQKSFNKKGGLARTSSTRESGEEEEEGPFSWSQSQTSKRAKQKSFMRNKPSFIRTPTSSARSAPTPEKPSPKTSAKTMKKSKNKEKAKRADKSSGDSELEDMPTFREPINIDVPSPVKPKKKKRSGDSPKFKVPPIFDERSFSPLDGSSRDAQLAPIDISSDSSLSTLPSSPDLPYSEEDPLPPRQALCPMCKAEVDPEMLKQFQALPKQRLREQQRFCASHKQDSATKEWQAQGYPEIDWTNFEERLQRHYPGLEKYLNAEAPSYYRNILESAQKSGQALRLSLTGNNIEAISCGYYGTKGAQKMLDAVMHRFSVKLRRLAKDDSLITKVGVVGYAQSVLVPELALRLIMEDMDVQTDVAREIMRESIDIGQKLNPQQDDVVPVLEEPEDIIMV
ncbi:hypothetical protein N7478_004296 [Penicillium angulare]|uniref:uncharacterized protein n=1 Tax=Penicillium angulare TaxID=116970 RepID=UPI00253FE8DB|nr:uncharacterized protein N7478_004296 [Penicillium angulare]KAJ5278924.1 hypothetical protein N7478_004296 [Penicillium angulare]